jgi:hypothetical protein
VPKQIRFSQLVKASGKPHAATLWVSDPASDPEFKKAMGENRIVSIHMKKPDEATDKAEIGFRPGDGTTFLIFPKAIAMEAGTRVIGLKFDELETPEVKDPVKIMPAKRHRGSKKDYCENPQKVEPATKSSRESAPSKSLSVFNVTLAFRAETKSTVEVQAANASEAIAKATKIGQRKPPKADWIIDAENVSKAG